jgi:hypothetical protein
MSAWMRVGIFCTALWAVSTLSYAIWHHFDKQNSYPKAVLETCMHYALNTSRCDALFATTQNEWKRIPFDWTQPMIVAFAPLPLFWLLGWLMLQFGRWVRKGSRQNSS